MSDIRKAILIFIMLTFSIVFVTTCVSANASPAGSESISTVRTIDTNQTFGNTSIMEEENATWLEAGGRSQNRLIHGGIVSILFMQMIILILIIQCRKHRTYVLKPVSKHQDIE